MIALRLDNPGVSYSSIFYMLTSAKTQAAINMCVVHGADTLSIRVAQWFSIFRSGFGRTVLEQVDEIEEIIEIDRHIVAAVSVI